MATATLGVNPKVRSILIGVAAAVGVFAITQFVLPGTGSENGTPPAVLFQGVVAGLLNALLAVGLILIYRSARIINFAQGALGAAGGVFTYNLTVLNKWPFLLAFVSGVIVAAFLGFLVEIALIRRFFNSPRLVLTVITIATLAVVGGASGYVTTLPIFPPIQDRTQEQVLGQVPVQFPFNDFKFQIGATRLTFGFPHLFAIGASVAAMIALVLFLRYSRLGSAIRASSENAERARLLGINVGTLSLVVWTIAGALSGLGVILSGTVSGGFSGGVAGPEVLLAALAAAVIAGMHSFPIAIAAALGLSILRESVKWSYEQHLGLLEVGLFVAILVALLFQSRRVTRSEAGESTAWKATEEQRATPKEMLEVGGVRVWRRALISLGVLALVGMPFILSPRQVNLSGYLLIVAIASLSLVILTGWAGQASLGQFAFVAVGAVVGGAIATKYSFWIALPVAPLVTAAFATLVGFPALRIKGLHLAVTTAALAFAVNATLFKEEYFGWLLPDRVDRPSLFLIDFEDERSMYYLALAGLLVAIVLVSVLRRSRVGRVLIAVRENEANIQSFGVSLVRTRLAAFAFSGLLCGFCGVLLAVHQRAVAESSFDPFLSFQVFLYTVVGGVGSIAGALLGAGYFAIVQFLPTQGPWVFLVGSVGVLALLYFAPGGLASLLFGLRDGILRIIAQRRQMVVPSLFADYDPLALIRRLIPLAEPIPNSGLAVLPVDQRYKGLSGLYAGRGRFGVGKRQSSEERAFGDAAKSIRAEDEESVAGFIDSAESSTGERDNEDE